MRDMTPPGEKSIRNIPVPAGHRPTRQTPIQQPVQKQETEEPMYEEDFTSPPPRRRGTSMSRRFWLILGIVVVLCACAGLLMATLFAGATVTVTPRSASVTAPAALTAVLAASADALVYQVVTTTRTASTTVAATGSGKVSKSASGVITIYNEYSTAAQDLVATTRFAAPDGKIYRIHTNVTVPGAKKAADGSLTPGTVTVTAYADAAGADYNRGQTQFTIPGFKGDPKYSKFYANTTSMSGGFVGIQAVVAPADLTTGENTLTTGLKTALQTAITTQVPQEFVVIPGTVSIATTDIVQTPATSGTVSLSESATASADIVRSDDLAAAIARQTVQGYNGEAVSFADISQLTLGSSTSTAGSVHITLSGTPTLVWQFDSNALQQALIGKPKAQFDTILKGFAPAITCSTDTPCKASIRPFWSSTFPSDGSKIKVITTN